MFITRCPIGHMVRPVNMIVHCTGGTLWGILYLKMQHLLSTAILWNTVPVRAILYSKQWLNCVEMTHGQGVCSIVFLHLP
jgi:hypothetical protein